MSTRVCNTLSNDTFAFVGPGATGGQFAEVASPETRGTVGTLSGDLKRNRFGQFYSGMANAGGSTSQGFQDVLAPIVYQQTVEWPYRTGPYAGAVQCIADFLGLDTPIEDNYLNKNLTTNWPTYRGQLTGMNFNSLPNNVPSCANPQFTATQFTTLQSQLANEFKYVPPVSSLIANLQEPYNLANDEKQAQLSNIVTQIKGQIDTNDVASQPDLEVLEDLMWAGSLIPADGADIGFSAAAIMLDLAQETATEPTGAAVLGEVRDNAGQIGNDLADDYVVAMKQMNHVGDILLSDWGKLSATYNYSVANPWTSTVSDQVTDALLSATTGWAYRALFPLVFTLYRFGNDEPDNAIDYSCKGFPVQKGNFRPFGDAPRYGALGVFSAAGNPSADPDIWAFGKSDERFLVENATERDPTGTPTQALINDMFLDPAPNAPSVRGPPIPGELESWSTT